ncbi:TlpA family protein disulfide reductase [Cellulophaga omnivescoria]|uniref:TlpA family protein disulfide reductase n=1 Tax=Cellulophaga omnivescoria TaxID=1888890 RepID=UPI001FEB2084|nr:TlpA disulfide reductase family protein [Cellulophaga omnivescoria]WBU89869.1 TlpA disulfide reductase family protein [Cellulophaga omnivescoria]WKB81990.1 TlpA disulfide reductase family protein [Cellulophaga lytica]
MKKKTVFTLLIMLLVAAFFWTPLGHMGKIFLNNMVATAPSVITKENQKKVTDYDWVLKDEDHNLFNFTKSKGNVIFINNWASWKVHCEAELQSIQKFYNDYKNKVDFYIITNEEKDVVEEFMQLKKFNFPVTYLIIDAKHAVNTTKVPSSYVIDKQGNIVIYEEGISNWDNNKVYQTIDKLLAK